MTAPHFRKSAIPALLISASALAGLDSSVTSTSFDMRHSLAIVSSVRATLLACIRDGVPPPKKTVSTMGRSPPCRAETHSSSRKIASIQPVSSSLVRASALKSK